MICIHGALFCYSRPLNAQEICMKSLSVVECSSNEEVIVKEPSVDGTSRTFAFDRVFGPNSRQVSIVLYCFAVTADKAAR